ncbi:MAG: hypothetical protein HFG15_04830, partial [Bacilli bacterium]|nr:hypothetical protein [Bacilli bacterium]
MKEVRDSMKVRQRNNQYFLIVETMGDQIKPKDPSLFHLTINHYTRFDHIYTFCPEEIGNRLSDIDRELLKYDCMEHFIDQYFTSYDPFEDQYKAFVRIELFKKKQKQRIDIEPLYHDYMMEEILESMDSKNETIPMLADSFLHYKEQFMNDIDQAAYRNHLMEGPYIGTKMKQVLQHYNGNHVSIYNVFQLMSSYPVLRGTYIAASHYFKELKEQKVTQRDWWLYHCEKPDEITAASFGSENLSYIDSLRYQGNEVVWQFYQSIINGTVDLSKIPFHRRNDYDRVKAMLEMMMQFDVLRQERADLAGEIFDLIDRLTQPGYYRPQDNYNGCT